jgi:hypothetical protein
MKWDDTQTFTVGNSGVFQRYLNIYIYIYIIESYDTLISPAHLAQV